MMLRNTAIRVYSLVLSITCVLAIKYVSIDPDTVSIGIMLTTLFFSILRSGFTFDVLAEKINDSKPTLSLTADKLFLVFLVYIYAHHSGVDVEIAIYTFFTAAILTFIYRTQYPGYTKGGILPSILISFIFPIQVTINLIINYYNPNLVFILVIIILALYLSYDRLSISNSRTGIIELYYSALLPIGGFSAISIEGIDKPLYMIVSKIIDSTSAVTSFVLQGNLPKARYYFSKYNLNLAIKLISVTCFIFGCMLYFSQSDNELTIISTSILVNVCWLIYSVFTLAALLKQGESALKNIRNHIFFFGSLIIALLFVGRYEPIFIVFSLSISFILSILVSRSVSLPLDARP